MNDNLQLYQQLILEHNKNPRNFGELPEATHTAEGYNPLCGDRLSLKLKIAADGKIEAVKFMGDGCAISRASASMMTQALMGLTIPEAEALSADFLSMLKDKNIEHKKMDAMGKLKIFSGIWQFPSRVKCAALAWHAYRASISEGHKRISTE